MDGSTMIKVATILFAITAVGGAIMAGIRFMGADRPPSSLAMAHGLLAGAGLTLLIYVAVAAGVPLLIQIAIGVLIIAALIGVALNLMYHSKLLKLPIPPIIIHALFGVAGLVMLIVVVLKVVTIEAGVPQ